MKNDFRILVVEDDEQLAATLQMVLGGEGYVVLAVNDGQEGLEIALSEEI